MTKVLGTKRTVLAALALVLLLAIATSPFLTVLVIRQHAALIVNDTFVGLTSSGKANIDITEAFLEMAKALNAATPAERQACIDRIGNATKATDERLKRYESAIGDGEDRKNFEALVQKRASYRETRTQVLDLLAKEKKEEANRLFQTECLPRFHHYMQALGQVVEYNAREASERGADILGHCNLFLVIQAALVLFFLIYAFFVPLVTLIERLTQRSLED